MAEPFARPFGDPSGTSPRPRGLLARHLEAHPGDVWKGGIGRRIALCGGLLALAVIGLIAPGLVLRTLDDMGRRVNEATFDHLGIGGTA